MVNRIFTFIESLQLTPTEFADTIGVSRASISSIKTGRTQPTLSLIEKIKIEEQYHPLTPGGHIFHAFMGESYSDPDSLMSLTNKIARKSDIGFWAYSSALSFCLKCKTLMKGLNHTCPTCGESEDVEWYDRITGYVQQVGRAKSASGGWNPGKRQELIDRRRFEDN